MLVAATGAALLLTGGAMAGESKCVINDKAPICDGASICDIFDNTTLYKNENAGLIQSVALTGRYHGQYHDSSHTVSNSALAGANGSYGNRYWEHRRFRIGTKVKLINGWQFYNDWNIGDSNSGGEKLAGGDFWGSLDTFGLKGKIGDLSVNIGKQKQKVTREYATSSKNILTFERSHIVNEVRAGKPWGLTLGLETGGIKHTFGGWLNGNELSADGGGLGWPTTRTRGSLSYNAEVSLNDATDFHFDYIYTNNSGGNINGRGNADGGQESAYQHVAAFGTESDFGKLDLVTDVIFGLNRETTTGGGGTNRIAAGEDTFGVVIMPSYDITDRLQLVTKYAYASNSRLHRPQRGATRSGMTQYNLQDVNTFYAGLNYRICGDNLKLMAGYEYLSADLYGAGNGSIEGDTWMLGVRTYW